MAEGAFRKAADDAGLKVEVDSVGTAAYHIGDHPDPRAIATAQANGVDISGFAGRQLETADFDRFTDTANLAVINARRPRSSKANVSLLMDSIPGHEGQSLADPYYGDDADFTKAWDEISSAVDQIIGQVKIETQAVRR